MTRSSRKRRATSVRGSGVALHQCSRRRQRVASRQVATARSAPTTTQTRSTYRSARRRIAMFPTKGSQCRPGFGSSSSSLLCWPSLATLAGDASLGSRPRRSVGFARRFAEARATRRTCAACPTPSCTRAGADGDASAPLAEATDFGEFFRNEERVHLRDEEASIERRWMRRGALLEEHIRLEEGQLFPLNRGTRARRRAPGARARRPGRTCDLRRPPLTN